MMKTLRKLETIWAATAFAELGEFETARQLLKEDKPRRDDRMDKRTGTRPRKEIRAD